MISTDSQLSSVGRQHGNSLLLANLTALVLAAGLASPAS